MFLSPCKALPTAMSVPLSPPPLRPFETKEALIEWLTVTVNSEKKGEIKKPPTGFICFRKWFNKFALPLMLLQLGKGTVADLERIHQSNLSKLLSQVWADIPEGHRAFWNKLDVKEYHLKRYPSFHSPESKAQREEEKRQQKEKEGQPRTAKKSGNTKPCRQGPKRSPKGVVRSSPYPSQHTPPLSSTIHPSNPVPLHALSSLVMPVQSSAIDAYLPSIPVIPAYRSANHPAMYVPPSSSPMATSSPFAFPPSFHPPSATLPFSGPLASPSCFAPPQSWSLHQQHALPPATPALPFPLTSALPAAPPAVLPPQAFSQATLGVPPSIPSPSGSQRSENDIDFLSFFEAPQGGAALGMPPLPMDNPSVAQQPTFTIPSTFFDVGMLDLQNLPK